MKIVMAAFIYILYIIAVVCNSVDTLILKFETSRQLLVQVFISECDKLHCNTGQIA